MPDDIFFDHMYRNGFQQFIDVVGVHAPGFAAPEIGPDDDEALQRWFTFRRVEDLRKIMLRYNDAQRQMAIMEFGYTTDRLDPTYAWFGVTEDEQADYLYRAYEYVIANWRPWIGLMSLIYLPNPQMATRRRRILVVHNRAGFGCAPSRLYQTGEYAQSLRRFRNTSPARRWPDRARAGAGANLFLSPIPVPNARVSERHCRNVRIR